MTHPQLKFAAFDLDGTLLDRSGQPMPGTVEGVRALRRTGLLPIVVTGRSHSLLAALRLDGFWREFDRTLILSDGTVTYDRAGGELTYLRSVPSHVFDRIRQAGIHEYVVEVEHRYVASSRRAALWFSLGTGAPRSTVAVDGDPRIVDGTIGVIHALAAPELLDPLVGDSGTVVPFHRTGAVVRPRLGCKAVALRDHLRTAFGEPDLGAVIAFGNAGNDLCLLAGARIGVAVEGSRAEILPHSSAQLSGSIGDFLHTVADRIPQLAEAGRPVHVCPHGF